jgi:hypothetical protein
MEFTSLIIVCPASLVADRRKSLHFLIFRRERARQDYPKVCSQKQLAFHRVTAAAGS